MALYSLWALAAFSLVFSSVANMSACAWLFGLRVGGPPRRASPAQTLEPLPCNQKPKDPSSLPMFRHTSPLKIQTSVAKGIPPVGAVAAPKIPEISTALPKNVAFECSEPKITVPSLGLDKELTFDFGAFPGRRREWFSPWGGIGGALHQGLVPRFGPWRTFLGCGARLLVPGGRLCTPKHLALKTGDFAHSRSLSNGGATRRASTPNHCVQSIGCHFSGLGAARRADARQPALEGDAIFV